MRSTHRTGCPLRYGTGGLTPDKGALSVVRDKTARLAAALPTRKCTAAAPFYRGKFKPKTPGLHRGLFVLCGAYGSIHISTRRCGIRDVKRAGQDLLTNILFNIRQIMRIKPIFVGGAKLEVVPESEGQQEVLKCELAR